MKYMNRNGKRLPKVITDQATDVGKDAVSRREFLALASTYGATAATAYGTLRLAAPARADGHAKAGGTVRVQMEVRALKDSRTFDWSQIANFSRGGLNTSWPMKTTGRSSPNCWRAGRSAMRPIYPERAARVTWNNGDPFTAEDVARNIQGWCDKNLEGTQWPGASP